MSAAAPDLILWDVAEEHFEEAVFLFEHWERALHSPRHSFDELGATIEGRLEAHLDGLFVAGREVACILDPELTNEDEPPRATVSALTLLFFEDEEITRRVIETALHAEGPLQQALVRALTLARVKALDRMLLNHFRTTSLEPDKAILLHVLTGRGVDAGHLLSRCFESKDKRLIGAVLDAVGLFGHREMLAIAEAHLWSQHPKLRASAIKASLTLGSQEAWQVCRRLARAPNIEDSGNLLLIAMLGGTADHEMLQSRLENRAHVAQVLWTLGFCGTVQAGDACLAQLDSKDERVAKAAAEAMAWIGGFDLNDKRFQESPAEPSDDETLPPLEKDDLGADLDLAGLDDLPVPNREAISQWWKENRSQLTEGQRHVLGCPYSPGAVLHSLEAGSLWRRHGVALELNIRTGGKHHVSTDTFSSRQRCEIAALSRMDATQWL